MLIGADAGASSFTPNPEDYIGTEDPSFDLTKYEITNSEGGDYKDVKQYDPSVKNLVLNESQRSALIGLYIENKRELTSLDSSPINDIPAAQQAKANLIRERDNLECAIVGSTVVGGGCTIAGLVNIMQSSGVKIDIKDVVDYLHQHTDLFNPSNSSGISGKSLLEALGKDYNFSVIRYDPKEYTPGQFGQLRQDLVDAVNGGDAVLVQFSKHPRDPNGSYGDKHYADIYGYSENKFGVQSFMFSDPGSRFDFPVNTYTFTYGKDSSMAVYHATYITIGLK